MRPRPLSALAPLAALILLLAPARLFAVSPAAPGNTGIQQLSELHAKLKTHLETLKSAAASLAQAPLSKELTEKLDGVLNGLPEEVERYRSLRSTLGPDDDFELVARVKDEIKKVKDLEDAWRAGQTGAAGAAPTPSASNPAVLLPDELRRLQSGLGELVAGGEKRFPVLAQRPARTVAVKPVSTDGGVQPSGQGARMGSQILRCANGFDGQGCGGTAVAGGKQRGSLSADAGQAPPRQTAAKGRGASSSGTGAADTAASKRPAAADATTAGAPGSLAAGRNPRLDQAAVPLTGGGSASAADAAGAHASATARAKAAPAVKPPPSPEVRSCVSAVNGPDAANPEHSTIAEMCQNRGGTFYAPVLAGLLDAVKEQFTGWGLVLNLVFFILGLLMAVATGGVALILKLLGLIVAGWAIYRLLASLITAAATYKTAQKGSADEAQALRDIGKIGGTILILIATALVGFKAGKMLKPGAAQAQAMESGLAGAADKAGVGGAADRIPGPVRTVFEKIFGGTPERPAAKPGLVEDVGAAAEKAEKPAGAAEKTAAEGERPPAVEEPASLKIKLRQKVAEFFGRDGPGRAARVADRIGASRPKVAGELKDLLAGVLKNPGEGDITPAEFNKLYEVLIAYARSNGVRIAESGSTTMDMLGGRTMGVYPKSPTLLECVGFGKLEPGGKVPPEYLHELAHLFHTIQMRTVLLRGGVGGEEAAGFLRAMEDGGGYLAIERAVTKIGSPLQRLLPNGRGAARFMQGVTSLIGIADEALGAGKFKVPVDLSLEEAYAFLISRLPALTGKSLESFAPRLPFFYFAFCYASNWDLNDAIGFNVPAKTLKAYGLTSDHVGVRDFINAALGGKKN